MFLVVLTAASCTSSESLVSNLEDSNSIRSASKQGEYVFNVLLELDQLTIEEYRLKHASLEEIREMGRSRTIKSEKVRNQFTGVERMWYEQETLEEYQNLRRFGHEKRINWKESEFYDYNYKLEKKEGVTTVDGKVWFKHNRYLYIVSFSAIKFKKDFKMVEIGHIKRKGW